MTTPRPARKTTRRPWVAALACMLALSAPAAAQADLDGRTLSVQREERTAWSRTYPLSHGALTGPLTQGGTTWLAVGPQLYAYDEQGEVITRVDLPGETTALDASGGQLHVTVQYGAVPETFTVEDGRLKGRVVFPPLPSATSALERAARDGLNFDPLRPEDPRAALVTLLQRQAQDPTNPFTHVWTAAAALGARETALARRSVELALAQPAPFFVSVRLARHLDAMGLPTYADRALDQARRSWAQLGYDPALPVSAAALEAYGDPLGYLRLLLAQNNTRRAEAWIRYLRDAAPRFEGHRTVYDRYARLLEVQGRIGEAYEWRAFMRDVDRGTLYGLGPNALLAVRDVARWATWALILALIATYAALAARAWTAQGRDLAVLGGRWRSWLVHPLSRARRALPSYWRFGEKLAVIAMLGSLLIALSAWTWSTRTHERANADVLNIGTYGGAWFYAGLENLGTSGTSPSTQFVRGLAAQLDGDNATALRVYNSGEQDACTLNNLGVLAEGRDDAVTAREYYRAALAVNPALPAPALNLTLTPAGFEANFHRQYGSGARLCYPDTRTIYRLVDGDLGGEIRQVAQNPWGYLTRFPSGLPVPLQWVWVGALLAVCFLSALWLLVPRAPGARLPARPWRFRLLALLLPGVAFLDAAWGLVLLLTWSAAVTGAMSAAGLLRFPFLLDAASGRAPYVLASILIGCYVVNALVLLLQEVSLAHRARRERQHQAPKGTPGRA